MKKVFICCLVSLLTGSVFAQKEEEKKTQEGTPSAEMSAIRLAGELAKYGYTNLDALSLIKAAEIIATTPTQELKVEKTEKNDTGKETKKTGSSLEAGSLLADAKDLAKGNQTLVALIEQTELKVGQTSRGRLGGPGEARRRVVANSYVIDRISYKGGQLAEVFISGDGDTDLDMYVYDENGNLIGKDDDYSDDCYVSWYPKWTGTFTVKVVNRGKVYNDYYLITN